MVADAGTLAHNPTVNNGPVSTMGADDAATALSRSHWSSQWRAVLGLEWALLRRHRRLAWAWAAVVLVPLLYALIFLWAVWDPAGHTQSLPVGLVNLDAGARYRERELNLGAEALASIERHGQFAYQRLDDREAARARVRLGELAFVLEIPAEFSRLAVPGERPGAAQLTLYTSEGNNSTSASLARRFAPEVAQRVNAMLGESRWNLVIESAQGSRRNLDTLRAALADLHHGADDLGGGLRRAREGAAALAEGSRETSDGALKLRAGAGQLALSSPQLVEGLRPLRPVLKGLESSRAPESDLRAFGDGLRQLHEGQLALARELGQLSAGGERIDAGFAAYGQSAAELPLVGSRLAEQLQPLQRGIRQLTDGLGQAQAGSQQLAVSLARVEQGVLPWLESQRRMSAQIAEASARLPEDTRLDAFVNGARELAQGSDGLAQGMKRLASGHETLKGGLAILSEGAVRLDSGIEQLRHSLPPAPDPPGNSAKGLAVSVESQVEVVAPVPNNGVGLMPNFVPLALWVGAVSVAYLTHWRRLAAPLAGCRHSAQVLGKLLLPLAAVLVQAGVMAAVLAIGLGLRPMQPVAWLLTLALASVAFLGLVFALVRVLGELGKPVAVLMLIVQVASAGAVLPIELSESPFQLLHPWLPLTWVVKAFRATLFGAHEGQYLLSWAMVAGFGLAGYLIGCLVGRWKVVPASEWRPPLDIE